MRISDDMVSEKFKNRTLIFVAIIVAVVIAFGISMLHMHLQDKAEATPSNTRNLEVAIVWSDNVEAHFGQSSSVTLYQNGTPISTVTLSSPLWWYQWTDLDSAASYDVRQNSTFANYYTEYAWDANNNVTIKNIQNGSPVPPWPTPTPGPAPEPETNIIIEYYEDGTPVNPPAAENKNTEAQAPRNNNAMIHTNPNDSSDEGSFDFGAFFGELTKNLDKAWLVYLGIIGLIVLFICEKWSARKK